GVAALPAAVDGPAALADGDRPAHAAELLVALQAGGAAGQLAVADRCRPARRLERQLEAACGAVEADGPRSPRRDDRGSGVAGGDLAPVELSLLDGAGGGDRDDLAGMEQQHDAARMRRRARDEPEPDAAVEPGCGLSE